MSPNVPHDIQERIIQLYQQAGADACFEPFEIAIRLGIAATTDNIDKIVKTLESLKWFPQSLSRQPIKITLFQSGLKWCRLH